MDILVALEFGIGTLKLQAFIILHKASCWRFEVQSLNVHGKKYNLVVFVRVHGKKYNLVIFVRAHGKK